MTQRKGRTPGRTEAPGKGAKKAKLGDADGGADDSLVQEDSFWMFDDADGNEPDGQSGSEMEEDPYEDETPDERRVRLAKEFLNRVKEVESDSENEDEEDGDEDLVSKRLHDSLREKKGILEKEVASNIAFDQEASIFLKGPHRQAVTSVALKNNTLLSVSKDSVFVHWDVAKACKVAVVARGETNHSHAVSSVALSHDGTIAATGDTRGLIKLWDLRTQGEGPSSRSLEKFKHAGAVTCLEFRAAESLELVSGSHDRTIKLWNVDSSLYVDTLFGHYSGITCMSMLPSRSETVLSGGEDASLRLWKISEESQLVYQSPGSSTSAIDACTMIRPDTFLSGGQDANLYLWSKRKKKPMRCLEKVHGGEWLTSLVSHPFSDLAFSGSSDGYVRMWKADSHKHLEPLGSAPLSGFVNDMALSSSLQVLACAVGREHRAGRWSTVPHSRNGVFLAKLSS